MVLVSANTAGLSSLLAATYTNARSQQHNQKNLKLNCANTDRTDPWALNHGQAAPDWTTSQKISSETASLEGQ